MPIVDGKLAWTPFPENSEKVVTPENLGRQEGPGEHFMVLVYRDRGFAASKNKNTKKNDILVEDPVTGDKFFSEVKCATRRRFRLSNSQKAFDLLKEHFIHKLTPTACTLFFYKFHLYEHLVEGTVKRKDLEELQKIAQVDGRDFFREYLLTAGVRYVVVIDKKRGYCELTVDEFCQCARIYSSYRGLVDVEIRKEFYGVQERRGRKRVAPPSGKPVRKRSVRHKVGRVNSENLQGETEGAGGRPGLGGGYLN